MATKTFLTSKDASVVLRTSDSASFGAGKDYHLYVGSSGGYTLRSLVQFNLDFSDVTSITSATLYFTTARSSDGTVDGYLRDTHGTFASAAMHISRVTSAWTEGTYGNDETFNGVNSVEWDNQPSTTTTNRVSFTSRSSRPASPALDSMDVTAMVTDWFNGSANYGIQIKYQTESTSRFTEWYSREGDASSISGAVAPYIVLTYSTVTNPTGTTTSPSASIAKITNLSDTTEWTSTSQHAMPEFNWSYTTGGGGAQTKWRLRIYSDSSKTTTYYDTGLVIDTDHAADATFSPVKNADKQAWIPGDGWSTITGLVNGTKYFWTIQVYDALGNASAESATAAFQVRWGQAVYEWDAQSTSTGSWSISHAQPPANTQAVVLYRAVASSGTTTGAWSSEIGPLIGTQRWLQTLVRMSTDDGTKPYVTDITFSYTSSAVPPDNWEINSGTAILDDNERRFGTKSALWKPSTTGASYIQPTRNTSEYDIPVLNNTRYTFSAYVKPVVIAGRTLKLRVFKSNGSTASITGLTEIVDINGVTASKNYSEFTADNEGWYRLTYTFETDSSTDYVKPVIYLYGTGASTDSLYLDGVQFEEGTVVRSWTPGFVTQAMTFEGSGLNIDGSTGGKLRLRGTGGGARDIVELGVDGLKFGGATSSVDLYSGSASTLNVTGDLTVSGAVRTAVGGLDPAVYIGDDALIFDADTSDALGIQGQQTPANGVIILGSGKDTNLYRGGANILKTDDAFSATGNITSAGYVGTGGRYYFDAALAGLYWQSTGTNGRLIQGVNGAGGGVDVYASTSSTTPGILGTKSIAGQPTTNVNGSGTTDAFADTIRNGGMVLDNTNQRFYVYSATAWRYAALTNPSDSRLKEEITEISGAIDKLRQLAPVAFKWKAPHLHERTDSVGDDGTRLGFIADQVATTDLKHWVETMHIGGEEAEIATGSPDETPVLAVNIPQNEMEALLVQALLDIDSRLKAIEDKL